MLNVVIDREHMPLDREGLPIGDERRTRAGLNLNGDAEVRRLRDALNEHLGETPADAGTIRIKVDTAEAVGRRLNDVRREIEKALDALPAFLQGQPTITITSHFPEPPQPPQPPDAEYVPTPEFDNVPGDEADEESLLDEVLAEARESVGLDPDDEEYGLLVAHRDDAELLERLLAPLRKYRFDSEAPQGPPDRLDLKTTANPLPFFNDKGVQVEQVAGDTEARVFLRAQDQHLTPDEAKQVRDAIDAFVRWAER